MQWNFLEVARMSGCGECCATTRHHLDPLDILRYHNHFASLSTITKKQWVLDYFIMNSSCESETPYFICGKVVCLSLWVATLDISLSYFYNVRSLYQQGHKSIVAQVHRNRPLAKTSEAMAWMESFFDLMGEKMPDRATVHLPSCLSKLCIYQRLEAEMRERGRSQIVSQSQFFFLWKLHFSHVSIPKVSSVAKMCMLFFIFTFFFRKTGLLSVMSVS